MLIIRFPPLTYTPPPFTQDYVVPLWDGYHISYTTYTLCEYVVSMIQINIVTDFVFNQHLINKH